ncbi:carcinoembryonic antigen-related cell adhesion molecule 18 [Eubalaena glacialis]|uniref:carcinoembryonic antigen-related cell adhesion molecule 18 n=1 Tax=Eubalaena glacialis TaxID=27606 RepID=UPI002A5A08D5|nr:carcinoembryonic antigen-related cell adhesion molecule 18 [Eubalaena glacialis]
MYIAPGSLIGVERYSSRLVIENAPGDAQEYSWHRDANDTEGNMIITYNTTSNSWQYGPMYSGRERVSNTGTLMIQRSQLNDTGNYTVQVDAINGTQRATGWLKIRELEIPRISVNTTSVVDDMDSVTATCYTNDSNVKWYVNYVQMSSNIRMIISPDNKTLIIQRFGRFDSPLQCGIEILPEIIQKSEPIYVTVAYGPYDVLLRSNPSDFSGILFAEIGSQVEVVCIAYSRPESKYRWIHNGSLLSFSEENVTLPSLTWDQMGRYRCVVENPITQLTLYGEVQVQAPWHPMLCTSFTISGSLVVLLIIVTILGGVQFCIVLTLYLIRCDSTRQRAQRPVTSLVSPEPSTGPAWHEETSGNDHSTNEPTSQ